MPSLFDARRAGARPSGHAVTVERQPGVNARKGLPQAGHASRGRQQQLGDALTVGQLLIDAGWVLQQVVVRRVVLRR